MINVIVSPAKVYKDPKIVALQSGGSALSVPTVHSVRDFKTLKPIKIGRAHV